MRLVHRFLTAVCWLLTAGCASVPQRVVATTVPALPLDIAAYYDYPDHTPTATRTPVRETPAVRECLVQFPLSSPGFAPTEPVVEFEWFESTRPGRRPAIVFNPILGGDYPLERGICRYLAAHGFHVAMVHRKTLKISPEHDVARLELLLRQGVIRIRQVVDWMAQEPTVDPARMGSFGISMGGMASIVTAAVEPRLRVHVVALAGGPITDILVSSHDALLTKPRAKYLRARHLELATLATQLRREIRTDPIRLAPYVDPDTLLLFIAVFDRTIGVAHAQRLRHALRDPPTTFLLAGHYTAYLYLPYLKRASLRFFQRRLGTPQPQ